MLSRFPEAKLVDVPGIHQVEPIVQLEAVYKEQLTLPKNTLVKI